jgi:anti-sigma factor RsiW
MWKNEQHACMAAVQQTIGQRLQQAYEPLVSDDMPPAFMALLQRLEATSGGRSASRGRGV